MAHNRDRVLRSTGLTGTAPAKRFFRSKWVAARSRMSTVASDPSAKTARPNKQIRRTGDVRAPRRCFAIRHHAADKRRIGGTGLQLGIRRADIGTHMSGKASVTDPIIGRASMPRMSASRSHVIWRSRALQRSAA
jgi:hypothetical protein